MAKRTDINSILIIGAGPIVIGQACEFDYSGAQACKALREEGYRVILVNSNPATIMTDPELADLATEPGVSVAAAETEAGHAVLLDGRPVKTPSKTAMILPSAAPDAALAAWQRLARQWQRRYPGLQLISGSRVNDGSDLCIRGKIEL